MVNNLRDIETPQPVGTTGLPGRAAIGVHGEFKSDCVKPFSRSTWLVKERGPSPAAYTRIDNDSVGKSSGCSW
jgi:hypothetical protein